MIIMKFGGTSLEDADCIRRAVHIVAQHRDQRPVVVVSAIGTTTRTLLRVCEVALADGAETAGGQLEELAGHHRAILADLGIEQRAQGSASNAMARYVDDIGQLLQGISLLHQLTPRTEDAIIAHGERFSTLLFAAAARDADLDVAPVDAATVMITDSRFRMARPDRAELNTRARATILPLVEQRRIPLIEGFIGATRDGVPTTLGFEASDYTASLLGAALDASEIQIWTDVGGMLTSGDSRVENVMSIRQLSFDEAAELSFFGAKVLHPSTIEPAVEKNIRIRILHSRYPDGCGTTIFAAPESAGVAVKSIAVKENVMVVNLRPHQPAPIHRTTWSVGEALDRHEVSAHLMASSGNRIVLALDVSQQLDQLLQELGETFEVSPTENCVIVSVVGEDIGRTPGVVTRAASVLEHIPLLMASYGASDSSASFVVSKDDVDEVVMMLHRELFGESAPSDIFVPTEVKAIS